MNKAVIRYSFLTLIVFLAGCDEQKHFNENFSSRWINSFRQYQIHPTFTSKEDIQVGDLILTCELGQQIYADNNSKLSPISNLLARFSVNNALQTFYNKSVKLPQIKDSQTDNIPDTETKDGLSRRMMDSRIIELKNAAFPDFLSARISGKDIGAALPAGKVMAGFGISSSDIESVSVSVPAVGTYQLPIVDLVSAVAQKENISEWNRVKKLGTYIEKYGEKNCENKQPLLILVSEAYAAYGLKVDVNLSSAAAAKIKAAVNVVDSQSKLDLINAFGSIFGIPAQNSESDKGHDSATNQTADGDTVKVAAATDQDSNEASKEPKATDRLKEFREYLDLVTNKSDANSNVGYPGVAFSTYSASVSGITIDRKFDTPVVVGVKGVKLEVCNTSLAKSCTIEFPDSLDSIISPSPEHTPLKNQAKQ
ncbi:MAG: hypothetical protein Q8R74_00895 [Methylophilus sp.]|nr:hypothetical protein [Methylophilus sp.]